MAHYTTRRRFLRNSAIVAATTGFYPAIAAFSAVSTLSLKAAGYRFPRTEALFSASLPIKGCDAHFEEAGFGARKVISSRPATGQKRTKG